jgi:hypothetical protein
MNKRILFIALIFIGLMNATQAQEKAFRFGFKVAPNIGWIKPNSEGYIRDEIKSGFAWGFIGDIHLIENYWFHTGFNVDFIRGAYHYPHKIDDVSGTLNRKLSSKYIQVPLVFKMKTNEINSIRYYGEIGFGLGFLFDAKAADSFYKNQVLISETEKTDVKKQYRVTRESLILGAGLEFSPGGDLLIQTGLRFDNNFIDILKDQNSVDSSIEQMAISNFVELQISLLF